MYQNNINFTGFDSHVTRLEIPETYMYDKKEWSSLNHILPNDENMNHISNIRSSIMTRKIKELKTYQNYFTVIGADHSVDFSRFMLKKTFPFYRKTKFIYLIYNKETECNPDINNIINFLTKSLKNIDKNLYNVEHKQINLSYWDKMNPSLNCILDKSDFLPKFPYYYDYYKGSILPLPDTSTYKPDEKLTPPSWFYRKI